MTTTNAIDHIRRYVIHSNQYLANALLALQNTEAGKAGELLWGSVAEALHAVAASKNALVESHRDLKNFAIQLARDLNDQTIQNDFIVAESLHHNFYDVKQETQDIGITVPAIQNLVKKLLDLLPPEALQEPVVN
jgi:hypothetical protein